MKIHTTLRPGMRRLLSLFSVTVVLCLVVAGCSKKEAATPLIDVAQDTEDSSAIGKETQDTESEPLDLTMYVVPEEGLTMRAEPSVSGEKLMTIPKAQMVYVQRRTFKQDTIDGITAHWFEVDPADTAVNKGWVFGAYLTETEPPDNYFFGTWRPAEDSPTYYEFDKSHLFGVGNENNPGPSGISRWSIEGNIITERYVPIDPDGSDAEYADTVVAIYEFEIIDENTMILKNSADDSIRLVRSESRW